MTANILTASHAFLIGGHSTDRHNGTLAVGPATVDAKTFQSPAISSRDRAKLAELDERLLVDLGIALDEVPSIRAGVSFTPRAWAGRR